MLRSRMKDRYLKNKTDLNWNNWKKQKNLCSNPPRKTKKEKFSKLGIIKINNSKKFWKTIFDKVLNYNRMILSETDQIISV